MLKKFFEYHYNEPNFENLEEYFLNAIDNGFYFTDWESLGQSIKSIKPKITYKMKKESIILEIRASEGGSDSKLIVVDMMNIYLKSARVNNFESSILENREGYVSI